VIEKNGADRTLPNKLIFLSTAIFLISTMRSETTSQPVGKGHLMGKNLLNGGINSLDKQFPLS
jgi:hypothetical protein